MIAWLIRLALAIQQPGREAVKDWASTVVAVAAVLAVIYTYAKSVAKWNGQEEAFRAEINDVKKSVNGLGERVKEVEKADAALDARADTIERAQDRASDDRTRLHERIGHAEKHAEDCEGTMHDVQVDIVARVNDMRLDSDREFSKLRERLAALEKEIDIRLRGNGR